MEIDEDGIIDNKVHTTEFTKTLRKFKVKRSSTSRYYLVCVDDRFSWYFKSSNLNNSNTFKARKFYNVHTCGNESRLFSQRHATSKFVGGLTTSNVDDPKTIYTLADIQRDIRNQYGVDLNYMKA
ncbi:hypothetical protein KY290_005424 [Solanum tuberosum]|uniref:Uncharacterized protein n=1 Tax=Solanum tuberosum TaxID=4113 RepID=A0ABQ7WGK6_SOLTU|nr:hypothetical protein KY290_005424 [Solanum tuberosum]